MCIPPAIYMYRKRATIIKLWGSLLAAQRLYSIFWHREPFYFLIIAKLIMFAAQEAVTIRGTYSRRTE